MTSYNPRTHTGITDTLAGARAFALTRARTGRRFWVQEIDTEVR
jgi:hypothetical protein